jgi:hypothetical protein
LPEKREKNPLQRQIQQFEKELFDRVIFLAEPSKTPVKN